MRFSLIFSHLLIFRLNEKDGKVGGKGYEDVDRLREVQKVL